VDVTPELRPAVENLFTASYRRELDHFMEVARGDQEVPLPDEQEMLMAIVEACYRSADEGREIVL
jgi:predicted dehydrogenase